MVVRVKMDNVCGVLAHGQNSVNISSLLFSKPGTIPSVCFFLNFNLKLTSGTYSIGTNITSIHAWILITNKTEFQGRYATFLR